MLKGELPDDGLTVRIVPGRKTEQRKISLSATGPKSDALLARIANALKDQ